MPAFDFSRYSTLSQKLNKQMAISSTSPINPQTETKIISLFKETILHLLKIQKSETKWMFAMGDAFFHQADLLTSPLFFKEALTWYLAGSWMEMKQNGKLEKNFYGVLERMIWALQTMKRFLAAAVFCQFLPVPDFKLAFKLIQDSETVLDSSYFQFFWEIPILELLVCNPFLFQERISLFTMIFLEKKKIAIYSQANDEENTALLISIIRKPELNPANHHSKEIFFSHLKTKFFKFIRNELGSRQF